jgi:hypothetical protein
MKTDARLLRKAHREAREALSRLVDPITETYDAAEGPRTYSGPSLITQLRREIANSTNHGVTRSRNAPIPINPDAYDLFVQITTWAGGTPDALVDRLRGIVAEANQFTDWTAVHGVVLALTGWANAITALLYPLRRYHIAKPCPRCAQVMVWRRMPTGERLQTHALVVDGTRGCECLACGAAWPLTHLEHLARVLGCDPLPGATEYLTIPG